LRARFHRAHRHGKDLLRYNSDLAEWLQETIPVVEVIAEVPERDRWAEEASAIKAIGSEFPLLNKLHNGYTHPPEVRARISAAVRRAKASRAV